MIDINSFFFIDREGFDNDLIENRGTEPHNREIEEYVSRGFIILDKPVGPTSHDVVATVKKILGVSKAGHLGTLDPNVSGVLPIGLGETTKTLSILTGSDKRYICNLKLHQEVDQLRLIEVLNLFTGEIFQFPPVKSNVAMKLRRRMIHEIKLLDQNGSEYLLDITCQAGTYIRVLCSDIGKVLGTGGEMKELRRIISAGYNEDHTVSLHDIFDAYNNAKEGISVTEMKEVIHPIEEVLSRFPALILRNSSIESVTNGVDLSVPGVIGYQKFKAGDDVILLTVKGELVALGQAHVDSDYMEINTNGQIIHPYRVILRT